MEGIEALSAPYRKRLLDSTRGLDRIILALLFETGLEVEDLINLRVSDVDLKSGTLAVTPDRTVSLSTRMLAELESYLQTRPGQGYLLEGRCGKPITCKWKRCVLEPLLLKTGVSWKTGLKQP